MQNNKKNYPRVVKKSIGWHIINYICLYIIHIHLYHVDKINVNICKFKKLHLLIMQISCNCHRRQHDVQKYYPIQSSNVDQHIIIQVGSCLGVQIVKLVWTSYRYLELVMDWGTQYRHGLHLELTSLFISTKSLMCLLDPVSTRLLKETLQLIDASVLNMISLSLNNQQQAFKLSMLNAI